MWMSTKRKSHSVKTVVTEDGTKFAYIAWIVYALHLVPQVATLFKLVTPVYNDKKVVFGPNVIKMNLCLTPMLFLFLIYAHQDARSQSRRKYYLEKITSAVTLDLFDSVEMLQYLFTKEKITLELENAILAFSCLNIFLPTLALFELKLNKFHENGEVPLISFRLIYICGFMFLANAPFLVLRLVLWHGYHLDVSVLLAKNVLAVIMGFVEIVEFFGQQKPRKCKACLRTFAKEHFKTHNRMCLLDQRSRELFDGEIIDGNQRMDLSSVNIQKMNDFSQNVSQNGWSVFSRKTYV